MRPADRPILVVDDDDIGVQTVRRALQELRVPNPVVGCHNGEEALNYLRDSSRPRPTIILLDLNMPVMNGIEFLRIVKEDEQLRQHPVVILTTSTEQQDKTDSFQFSVAGYMAKPMDYRQFIQIMRHIDQYWTSSELP
ncbi:MAG: response regulator [Bordetella sp.]|uniref:response regulator n=1 Tax=Bordetella sp. TaxID=28081 RepID=UPI003F7CA586